jgi:hypothetical protein
LEVALKVQPVPPQLSQLSTSSQSSGLSIFEFIDVEKENKRARAIIINGAIQNIL